MSQNRKQPFLLELIGVAARSYVLWSARILIISWYIYFLIHLDLKGGGYSAVAMMLLSIFGLIEPVAKLVGLKDGTPRNEPPE